MIKQECKKCGEQIGLTSFITSLILGCFKLFIGIKTGSHALMANAFYSIQDIISAGVVLMGTKYSRRNSDEKYPYGYGKIEFIISVAVSAGIIIGVLIISFFAGRSVLEGPKRPGMLAFWCAMVSILTTYFLSHYVKCSGNTLNSPAIISSAQHIHADTISSICVAIGIVFAFFGIHHLDPIIAIFEAIHIVITTVKILNRGIMGLMDASLPDKEVKKINKIIENTEGVKKIILLKTRQLGQKEQIDCEVEIEGAQSFAAANKIKKRIKSSISEAMQQEYAVSISVAPVRSDILGDRQKNMEVIEILKNYYRHFIDWHELKVSKKRIDLSLRLSPDISDNEGERLCNGLRRKLEMKFPDSKVAVVSMGNRDEMAGNIKSGKKEVKK